MRRILLVWSLIAVIMLALPVSAFANNFQDGKVVLGDEFVLKSGETLDGDLAVLGGSAKLEADSTVTGSILLLGGSLHGEGEILGDIAVLGGSVNLGPSAVVYGNIVAIGGQINPGEARIEGQMITQNQFNIPFDMDFNRIGSIPFNVMPGLWPSLQVRVLGYLFFSFLMAALAVVFVMFWPNSVRRVAGTVVDQPVISGGLGLLTLIVVFPVGVLLVITLCLAPIGLIVLALCGIGWAHGWVSLGTEIGTRVGNTLNQEIQPVLSAALGTLILSLMAFGFLFIPCVGWIVPIILGAIGLGSVLLTRFGTQDYPPISEDVPALEG